MPALKNQKDEGFCQLTLQGTRLGWSDAYLRAGYRTTGHAAEVSA
jgi:hypothetical protein